MSKNLIIWILAILIIVIILALGWWYFSKTNSTTSQPTGAAGKAKISDKSITAFAFPELGSQASEAIDNSNHTVIVIVPTGTDVTSLTPTISVPYPETISPNSDTVEDFTAPVTYTVTAQDGSTQKYTVTVKIATPEGTGGS